MEDIALYEHETRGNHITWSNRPTNGIIYSRIDRAICNRESMDTIQGSSKLLGV